MTPAEVVPSSSWTEGVVIPTSVGRSLLMTLEPLGRSACIAFILHDMLGIPHKDLAPLLGCTPAAARRLTREARLRARLLERRQARRSHRRTDLP